VEYIDVDDEVWLTWETCAKKEGSTNRLSGLGSIIPLEAKLEGNLSFTSSLGECSELIGIDISNLNLGVINCQVIQENAVQLTGGKSGDFDGEI